MTSAPLRIFRHVVSLALVALAVGCFAAEPARATFDAAILKKAAGWADSLGLSDAAKTERVRDVIATHLTAVRDWHNAHVNSVPEGNGPDGKPLSKLQREMLADSAMPKSVHAALMSGLRAELSEPQVEAVLDKYTVGKVEFTLKGYRAIVPDLTAEEERVILGHLKQAREEAVDYKNMPQISAVFEVYKTKCEQYLNSNGRDWKALYRAFTDRIKAEKAAKAAAKDQAAKKSS